MCATTTPEKENSSKENPTRKLMVSAFVCLKNSCPLSTEVRRGMPVLSAEGQEIGKVAAAILDSESRKATHILLSRLPEVKGYWMAPVEMISHVCEEGVRLNIAGDFVNTLTPWHSEDG